MATTVLILKSFFSHRRVRSGVDYELTSETTVGAMHRPMHRPRVPAALSRIKINEAVWLQCFALAAISLAAGILRFYKLGAWSFWGDEVLTVQNVADGFNSTWFRSSFSLALIQLTISAFGTSEWTARLVPAFIGVITIPILYLPVNRIFGPAVAIVASLLLALAPWHLYWSQNARFYTLLLLFYTLALLAFYLGLEEDRPVYLAASLLLLGLASRERLLALFFVPVMVSYVGLLYVLKVEKPAGLRPRNLAIFAIPGLLVLVLFVWPYVRHIDLWMAGFGTPNNHPIWLLAGVIYYVQLSTICLALVGALYLLRRKDRAGLYFGLGAMIPLVTIMALSPFHYTANRYVFVSLTSWIILAAVAVVHLLRESGGGVKVLAVGVLLLLVFDAIGEDVLYYKYQNGNRDDWKAAFAYVDRNVQAGDEIVSSNSKMAEYYLGSGVTGFPELSANDFRAIADRTWFVEDMTTANKWPLLHRWLRENARQVADFDVHVRARTFEMNVFLYDRACCSNDIRP